MFHLISIWLTRIVVLGVVIALVVMYGIPKWFGEDQATPAAATVTATAPASPAPAVRSQPASAEPRDAAPATTVAPDAAPAEKPVATADRAAPVTNIDRIDPQLSVTPGPRCQPIGRTARGELVYSMDCKRVPQD